MDTIPPADNSAVNLKTTLKTIDSIWTESGNITATFRQRASECYIAEAVASDIHANYLAAYEPFDGNNFLNTICYRPEHLLDLPKMLEWRFHEAYHGMQFARSAALHAHFNPYSPIAFSPASAVRLFILMELDAYAKTSWLLSNTPLASTFKVDRASYNAMTAFNNAALIQDNLFDAACKIRTTIKPEIDPVIDLFEAAYAKYVLDWFSGDKERDYADKIICRIGDEDIKELGWAFGPNMFEMDNERLNTTILPALLYMKTSAAADRIAQLNQSLGISESALPAMGEVLSANKIDRASFIQTSKSSKMAELYLK